MKLIKFVITMCLLLAGLSLTYEKIEIGESEPIKEESIVEQEEKIVDEDVITEAMEEKTNDTITSNDNVISTKKSKNTTTKSTTKNDTKTKNNSTKSNNIKNDNNDENKSVEKQEEVKPKPSKEEPKEEKNKKEQQKPQCSDFYESITHGKVDKSSKTACVSYGNKIQNNELDEVLDYNEENGNTRKPTISYFRCYEVVDSNCNTKGWYLHFFCNSGGCDDNKLKSLYG